MASIKTAGNATIVAYDETPVIATDPWLGEEDGAYFGSWNLSHRIPEDIKQDILSARFLWFSHGHPDHLNPQSLLKFTGKKLLLPDHVGGRILNLLKDQGFDAHALPDRQWVQLSPKVKVQSITTMIQDAVLLLDVNGRLFVNLNDAGMRGCRHYIRRIVKDYPHSHTYLMKLSGFGDADMINFYDDGGHFVEPRGGRRHNVGARLSKAAKTLGTGNVIPFSSFHTYQRTDSRWAERYATSLGDYRQGFDFDTLNFIDPFVMVDCENGEIEGLDVDRNCFDILSPEQCGDDWSELLSDADRKTINVYFSKKEYVRDYLGFVNFKVGGRENFVKLNGQSDKGITFEVPRNSLMQAVEWEIFDDLLIGNFMKTTLHNLQSLYEADLNFYITKYGDNGRAHSYDELENYFREYHTRLGIERYYDMLKDGSDRIAKRIVFNRQRARSRKRAAT